MISWNMFKTIMRLVKDILKSQEWHSSVENSSKCTSYRIFKTTYFWFWRLYLDKLPKDLKDAFVKFWTTNNKLPIVTALGRFCTLCNKNCIGDEFHFTLECTYFDNLRKLYFCYPKHHKILRLIDLNKFWNTKSVNNLLSIFIKKILKMCVLPDCVH